MADSHVRSGERVRGESQSKLCDLLLEVAGRDTNRLPSVRRHTAVLSAAIPYMDECQAQAARQRIGRLETKWGRALRGNDESPSFTAISPELWAANWLAVRRNPEALLEVVQRAATAIGTGFDRLLDVQEYAYAETRGRTLSPPSYDTFKEWMIQLRIAEFRYGGAFCRGSLCHWWVNQMVPSKQPGSSYLDCLAALSSLRPQIAS